MTDRFRRVASGGDTETTTGTRRRARSGRRLAGTLLLAGTLAACGAPSPPDGHATRAREEAVARADDLTVRASVVPTMAMGQAVADGYRIERDPRTQLLMIAVRRGDGVDETAVPARVVADAIDLRGVRQRVTLREVAHGDLTDHIGVVRLTPPDTLRFHVEVQTTGARPITLQFARDFYP